MSAPPASSVDPGGRDDLEDETALGPGCAVFLQFAATLRELRQGAGKGSEELARESTNERGTDPRWVTTLEAGQWQAGVLKTLGLAGSLGVSIDMLTERIFWNPGEIALVPEERRSPDMRISGHFSIVPAGPALDPGPAASPTTPVGDRAAAALAIGRNVLDARRRRHLGQRDLGLRDSTAAWFIEKGKREPGLEALAVIARTLELPVEFLLRGMCWDPPAGEPDVAASIATDGPGVRHLYDPVARLWLDDHSAPEIAAELGVTRYSIEAIVRRLRAQGRVPYRSSTATADEEGHGRPEGPEEMSVASRAVVLDHIATNLRSLRRAAGLSARQLAEAAELSRDRVFRAETRPHDISFSTVVRLAASMRVPASRVTDGISWDPSRGGFLLSDHADRCVPATPIGAIVGGNVGRVRRESGLSQRSLGARAGISRRNLGSIETGGFTARPITLLRLAHALERPLADLFQGTHDWYVRPLPPPEFTGDEGPPTTEERWAMVARLWVAGRERPEIADAVGMTESAVSSAIDDLRARGVDLPYRVAPSTPIQLGTRRRGRRAARAHRDRRRRVDAARPARLPFVPTGGPPGGPPAGPPRDADEAPHLPPWRGTQAIRKF